MDHHHDHDQHTDTRDSGEFRFSWLDTWWPALLIAFAIVCVVWLGSFDPQRPQTGSGSDLVSSIDKR